MGYAHIMWILEDGIRNAKKHPDQAPKYAGEVGGGVIKLCLDPTMVHTDTGALEPLTSEPVLNQANCINHAAKLHSTDEEIFIWSGNCLRTLDQIPDDQLDGVRCLFDARYKDRRSREE